MASSKKKKQIDLPVKLILSEIGVTFFMSHKKRLSRFKMADNREERGIFLNTFSALSIQRMLLTHYLYKIEISRPEFISKRQEVMDLGKLVVYGLLYSQFDATVFDKVVHSNVIQAWNRNNPGNIIDAKTKINESFIRNYLEKRNDLLKRLKKEILQPVYESIRHDESLRSGEKNVKLFLSERYLGSLRPFTWFLLVKFIDEDEIVNLLGEIRRTLLSYMDKAKIAEYLSLMIMELASNAENSNIRNYAKRKWSDYDPQAVFFDPDVRKKLLKEMEKAGENVSICWELGGRSSSIGTANRLNITFYNHQPEYREFKQNIDNKKDADMTKISLAEFYNQAADSEINTDMGLYYLSYLNDECEKVGIRFDSLVNQIMGSDVSIITLKLNF